MESYASILPNDLVSRAKLHCRPQSCIKLHDTPRTCITLHSDRCKISACSVISCGHPMQAQGMIVSKIYAVFCTAIVPSKLRRVKLSSMQIIGYSKLRQKAITKDPNSTTRFKSWEQGPDAPQSPSDSTEVVHVNSMA